MLNVITGNAAVSAALVAHPHVAKISFIGSTTTGKRIAIAAAPTLKRVTLELGGNDAATVLPEADLDAVADTVFAISFSDCRHFCTALPSAVATMPSGKDPSESGAFSHPPVDDHFTM